MALARKSAAVTREVLIKHVGLISKSLDLEHWGKFKTKPYILELLRYFKCPCYRHHTRMYVQSAARALRCVNAWTSQKHSRGSRHDVPVARAGIKPGAPTVLQKLSMFKWYDNPKFHRSLQKVG